MIRQRLTLAFFVLLFSNVTCARFLNTFPPTSNMPVMELPQLKTKPQKVWFKDPAKYMIGGALLVTGIDVGSTVLSKKTVSSKASIELAVIGLCFGLVASRIVAWRDNKKIDAANQAREEIALKKALPISTFDHPGKEGFKGNYAQSSMPTNSAQSPKSKMLKPDWPF